MRRLLVVLGSVALLSLIVARAAPAQDLTAPVSPATPQSDVIPGLETFAVDSAAHTEGHVAYPQSPPVGGPHSPVWQNCRFYDEPVINEHAVHSLEHGAVWITYQPDLPQQDRATLRRLAQRNRYVLVSPYPGLDAPVVASAWGAQIRLDGVDDPRLRQFIRLFAGNGPERGGPCNGGTAETVPLAAATPGATPAATPSAAATPIARAS